MFFFYILLIIPLRMTNCSQGINQKSVFYSFGNHPLTDSTWPVKQWQRDTCSWSCTDVSNYLLSYTHSRAFPLFVLYISFFLFFCTFSLILPYFIVFWRWACRMNCSSLLDWGERILPQTSRPLSQQVFLLSRSYFSLISLQEKSLVVGFFFFFCLFTARSLPHICSTAKLLTSSQPRLPPPPSSKCFLWSKLLFCRIMNDNNIAVSWSFGKEPSDPLLAASC